MHRLRSDPASVSQKAMMLQQWQHLQTLIIRVVQL
jgi:hypothetical protein